MLVKRSGIIQKHGKFLSQEYSWKTIRWEGLFLFGIIPLYIDARDVTYSNL